MLPKFDFSDNTKHKLICASDEEYTSENDSEADLYTNQHFGTLTQSLDGEVFCSYGCSP